MATGASAAKRDAKRQAADAYYKALKESKRAERLSRVDTQGRRKLSDQLGEDMSYQSKRLAQKADKVGREINSKGGEFNAGIDKYNKRYDALQEQMKGRPVGKYNGTSSDLIGKRDQEFARIDGEISRLQDEEDAYRKSNPNAGGRNAGVGVMGHKATFTPLDESQSERAKKIQALQEERGFVDSTSKWVGNSYRHLGNLESTFQDLNNLSQEAQGYKAKPVQSSDEQLRGVLQPKAKDTVRGTTFGSSANDPLAQNNIANLGNAKTKTDIEMVKDENSAGALVPKFAEQYKALGDKLKQNLARDQRMAMPKQKAGGLLSAELMSGNGQVDKEVIG
jgi:hypothetical protein